MTKTAILALSLVFLFSCKDKDEDLCTTTTASVAGSYKITGVSYKENANANEVDYFAVWTPDACERDDIITFNSNGTYQYTDAGVDCSPSGNDVGTWALAGTTSMTIDGDAVTLESFDCRKLIIVNNDTQLPGDKLKLTLTKQ